MKYVSVFTLAEVVATTPRLREVFVTSEHYQVDMMNAKYKNIKGLLKELISEAVNLNFDLSYSFLEFYKTGKILTEALKHVRSTLSIIS